MLTITAGVLNAYHTVINALLAEVRQLCGNEATDEVAGKLQTNENHTRMSESEIGNGNLVSVVFKPKDSAVLQLVSEEINGNPNSTARRIPPFVVGVIGEIKSATAAQVAKLTAALTGEMEQKQAKVRQDESLLEQATTEANRLRTAVEASGYLQSRKPSNLESCTDLMDGKLFAAFNEATALDHGLIKRYICKKSLYAAVLRSLNNLDNERKSAADAFEKSRQEVTTVSEKLAAINPTEVWKVQCKEILYRIANEQIGSLGSWQKVAKAGELISAFGNYVSEAKQLRRSYDRVQSFLDNSFKNEQEREFHGSLSAWTKAAQIIEAAKAEISQANARIVAIGTEILSVTTAEAADALTRERSALKNTINSLERRISYQTIEQYRLCHDMALDINLSALADAVAVMSDDLNKIVAAHDSVSEAVYGVSLAVLNAHCGQISEVIESLASDLDRLTATTIVAEVNNATPGLAQQLVEDESKSKLPIVYKFGALHQFVENGGDAVILGLSYGSYGYCTKGHGGNMTPMYTWLPGWLNGFAGFQNYIAQDFNRLVPWQLFATKHIMIGRNGAYGEVWLGVRGEFTDEVIMWFPCPASVDKVNLQTALNRYSDLTKKSFHSENGCDVYNGHIVATAQLRSTMKDSALWLTTRDW